MSDSTTTITIDIIRRPSWWHDGACLGAGVERFFTERTGGRATQIETKRAKKVCAGCSVREQCLEYALDNRIQHGVWGGTSEKERRAMRRHRKQS